MGTRIKIKYPANMIYKPGEMARIFADCVYPKKQITIFQETCLISRDEVIKILLAEGIDSSLIPVYDGRRKSDKITQEAIDDIQQNYDQEGKYNTRYFHDKYGIGHDSIVRYAAKAGRYKRMTHEEFVQYKREKEEQKLSASDREYIKKNYIRGSKIIGIPALAKKFGVGKKTIRRVLGL